MVTSIYSNSDLQSLFANSNLSKSSMSTLTGTTNESDTFQLSTDSISEPASSSDSSSMNILDILEMLKSNQKTNNIQLTDEQKSSGLGSADADGDGTISADEYESLMSQMGIEDYESSEDFFAKFDSDSDGEITSEEMDAARPQGPPPMGPPPEEDATASSLLDTNGDGVISSDEYAAMISQLNISDEDAQAVFTEADSDSDGNISTEELQNMFSSKLKAYAVNNQFMFDENMTNVSFTA